VPPLQDQNLGRTRARGTTSRAATPKGTNGSIEEAAHRSLVLASLSQRRRTSRVRQHSALQHIPISFQTPGRKTGGLLEGRAAIGLAKEGGDSPAAVVHRKEDRA
jgi:hypothetical protein